ncbi:hypothetical protein CERSUDRAFT_73567 [Gelatoporia subvermispora B]|uniref:Uncharacterized protein n=1 Tax=Ceriporiopsis subvermispora (strain B) TaxID=914234 RepID=M2PMU2_CERS8|nr:hypothetical protein CERSUDRAFT_73567 [Gelatoporia subvermispora B]
MADLSLSPKSKTQKKSAVRCTEAESASIQSHLSTNSQLGYRVRAPSIAYSTTEANTRFLNGSTLDQAFWGSRFSRHLAPCLQVDLSAARHFVPLGPRLRWLLAIYCLLSIVYTSYTLCSPYFTTNNTTRIILPPPEDGYESSPLQTLPIDHLMSKLSSIRPHPKALEPFVLKGIIDPTAITACLWASQDHLESILPWSSRWPGPISLLMTTSVAPSSPEHQALLEKLATLKSQSQRLNATLSLHLLHLDPKAPENANAFLNLARVFAQTPRIVLFPGNLSLAPPKALYRSIITQPPSSTSLEPAPEHSAFKHRPVVFTVRGQTSFPFAPLAPLMLGRDDAVWCTERFFPPFSRAADWEECLWQVWLENFGDVDVRQSRGWLQESASALSTDSATTVTSYPSQQ